MSHPDPKHDPENVYPNDSMPMSKKKNHFPKVDKKAKSKALKATLTKTGHKSFLAN